MPSQIYLGLCLLQVILLFDLALGTSITTSFYNSTAKKGSDVELHITNFTVSSGSLSYILCGLDEKSGNFKSLAFYDKVTKGFKPSSSIPSNFAGRVAVRDTVIVIISNISVADEGTEFYCQLGYDTTGGEPRTEFGARHLLRSVQEPPRITGSVLPPTYTVPENSNVTLTCSFVSRPAANISWGGTLSRYGIQHLSTIATGTSFNTTSMLTIIGIKPWHNQGTISCHAFVATGRAMQNTIISVTYRPLNTTLSSTPKYPKVGSNSTLNCSATANPTVTRYDFFKNGVLVGSSTSGLYTIASSSCISSTANYSCTPQNTLGPGLSATELLQFYDLKVTSPKMSQLEVKEFDDVTLHCNASGCPLVTYQWFKNNNSVLIGSKATLTLSKLSRNDEGTFQCKVGNGKDNQIVETAITVNIPAKVSNLNATHHNACVGDEVTISCIAEGKPVPQVQVSNGSQVLVSGSGSVQFVMTIDSERFGTYTCTATNKIQSDAKNITIQKRDVSMQASSSRELQVLKNSNLTIQCSSSVCPNFKFKWYKNNSSTLLTSSPSLTIFKATIADEGVYKCVASYGQKNITTTTTVVVNAPATISELKATPNVACDEDTVVIQCKAGGKPNPQVELRNGSQNLTSGTGSAQYSLMMDSSKFGIYTCIVKNKYNIEVKNITVSRRVRSSEPRNISIKSTGSSKIEVKVSQPRCSSAGGIHSYAVYIKPSSQTVFKRHVFNCSTQQCSFVVEGLKVDMKYDVQVASIASDGKEGDRSSIIQTRTNTIKSDGDKPKDNKTTIILVVAVSLCAVAIIAVSIGIYRHQKSKVKRQVSPNSEPERGKTPDSDN